MLVLRDPGSVFRIADPDLRALVAQRFEERDTGEDYDEEVQGFFVVVEPGDGIEALEAESGCRILRNLFDEVRFGQPGFAPSFEVLEEHAGCFEMVFVPGDGDFGVGIFVPKHPAIPAELLALCACYASPAPELMQS